MSESTREDQEDVERDCEIRPTSDEGVEETKRSCLNEDLCERPRLYQFEYGRDSTERRVRTNS